MRSKTLRTSEPWNHRRLHLNQLFTFTKIKVLHAVWVATHHHRVEFFHDALDSEENGLSKATGCHKEETTYEI